MVTMVLTLPLFNVVHSSMQIIIMLLGADNNIDIVLILYRWAHLLLVTSVKKLRAETLEEALLLRSDYSCQFALLGVNSFIQ
jgi:hypothetical protein